MQDVLSNRPVDRDGPEPAPSLVRAVYAQRRVVLACIVACAALGASLSQLQQPRWTAQSRIFLSATADFDPLGPRDGQDPGRFVADQVAVLDSTGVLADVVRRLGLTVSPADLRQDTRITGSAESNVITVRATAGDAETAKALADAIPNAYQRYVQGRVDARADRAVALSRSTGAVSTIKAAAAVYGDGVASVEEADVPTRRSSPQPLRNTVILGLIGLLAGTGYALWMQSWSRRRVGPAEASSVFGAPLLGEIADRGRIGPDDEVAAAYSEPGDAYRMAAVALDYIRGAAPGVFLVTAAHDGAGTSLTALNLAAAAADHGRRVFLLGIEDTVRPRGQDAGLRVPLHDLARGRIDLTHAVERRRASRAQFGVVHLQVLQPVQGHPVPDVQAILDQLPDDTDLVLLDSPPLPSSSASFVLAGQVDAAVVVVDDATTPAEVEELNRRCRLAAIPVAGVLVNHVHPTGASGRRARRPAGGAVPARAHETSPRGLPLLVGTAADRASGPDRAGAASGPRAEHEPRHGPDRAPVVLDVSRAGELAAPPEDFGRLVEPPPTPAPARSAPSPDPGHQLPPQRAAARTPWSSVTRVTTATTRDGSDVRAGRDVTGGRDVADGRDVTGGRDVADRADDRSGRR